MPGWHGSLISSMEATPQSRFCNGPTNGIPEEVELLGPVAEDILHRRAAVGVVPLGVLLPQPFADHFRHLPEAALAFLQGFPVVLNAANEVAVAQFLEGRIGFGAIAEIVAAAMDAHTPREMGTIEAIRAVDQWARNVALDLAVEVQR